MLPEYSIAETYKDVASLVVALHEHRLDLMNNEHVRSELDGMLAARVLSSRDGFEGVEKLVATALQVHRVELRKAIFAFVKSRPSMHWILLDKSYRPTAPPLCPAAIFPRPAVCEGRQVLIANLVAIVTGRLEDEQGRKYRAALLHGQGGIGKSTIALEVLRAGAIAHHFGKRCFFVGCEGLSSLDDLLVRLVIQLAVPTSGQDTRTAVHNFASCAPALLVLDNFEDLCQNGAPPQDVEDFLSSLSEGTAGADGLTLIVTKRGGSNLRIPHSRSFAIDALDNAAATKAFLRHADRDNADAEPDPDLADLIARLDGYPLALGLLAQHYDASAGVTARHLLRAYDRRRDQYLKRSEAGSRQTSLQISVDLGLDSHGMSVVGAKDLCFLLSLVPEGADEELVEMFLNLRAESTSSEGFDVLAMRRAVVGGGLAAVNHFGMLRMLAPLREYISGKGDIGPELRDDAVAAVRDHARAIIHESTLLPVQTSAAAHVALRDKVKRQLGNLSAFVSVTLDSSDHSELREGILLSSQLALFIWRTHPTIPSFLVKALDLSRTISFTMGEADCLRAMGYIFMHQSNSSETESTLRRAREMYSTLPDRQSESADALRWLGILAVIQHDLPAADAFLVESLRMFRDIIDRFGESSVLEIFAELALLRGDLATARTHILSSPMVHGDEGHPVTVANSAQLLGKLALHEGNFADASSHLERAQDLYDQLDNPLGRSNNLHLRARLALQQNDSWTAAAYLKEALPVFEGAHSRYGTAQTHMMLGDATRMNGDFEAAREHLNEALRLNKVIGSRGGEAGTLQSFGNLAMAEGDFATARSRLEEALAMYRELGYRAAEEGVISRLGELEQRQKPPEPLRPKAKTRFVDRARNLFHHRNAA